MDQSTSRTLLVAVADVDALVKQGSAIDVVRGFIDFGRKGVG